MTPIYRSAAAQHEVEEAYRALLDAWPVDNRQMVVSTRYGDSFVISSGPETAPHLLLLHGAMANAATWMVDVADYAQYFRCHAIDMIGEPGLSAPSRPDLGSDAYAQWLDDVLAALDVKETAVVGLSLGGWLALDYAIRRPARVTALAVIAPGGVGRIRNLMLKALPFLLLGRNGMRRLMEKIVGPEPDNLSATGRAFFALMDRIRRQFRPRRHLPRFSDVQLQALDKPILAIIGGKDIMIDSDETRRRLSENVPRARISYRPEGLHYMPDTAPEIVAFLREALEGAR